MPDEAEVLLLPGLPLVNRPGKNLEPDLWAFEIETPSASVLQSKENSPPVMIDYVHPGDGFDVEEGMVCLILRLNVF